MFRLLSALLMSLLPATLNAAETYSLTLAEAVALAARQNPDVVLARLDEQRAVEAARIVANPFSPRFFVGSGLAYSSGFPQSIEGSAPSVLQARGFYSIFNRPLQYQVSEARENARGAAIDVALRRDEVAWRTALLYLDVERARDTAALITSQTDPLQRALDSIAARVAEGRALPIDEARARVSLARARQRLAALGADQAWLEAALAVAVGYTPEDRVVPTREPRVAAAVPATDAEAVDQALASSKELRRLESSLAAKRLALRGQQSARLPQLDLVAQYGLLAKFNNYEEFFQRFQRHNVQIGTSITLPVLPGSAIRAGQAQSQLELQRLQTQVSQTRHRIALDVRRARQDVRNAEDARQIAQLDLAVAREQLGVLEAQVAEGRAAASQVEEGRVAEIERLLALGDAEQSIERSRLTLLRVSGTIQDALR